MVPTTGSRGRGVCCFFFDLRKAFDSVPHRALLEKLERLDINPVLVRWICSYLMGRRQKVVVDGETSESISVVSGVPQGSVLGPLLFLIYIDDVTDSALSPDSKISLYADDMLLFKTITSTGDYVELQKDVDTLNNWVTTNHLSFNTSKCKYMLISRKKYPSHPPTLVIGSSTLERVYSYKYLGLRLTSTLCWSDHINDICIKAKKLIGMLYRRFYKNMDSQSLFQLYLTLVRPHTEYASQVWNPYLQRDIQQLERVQKFALRMCSKRWDLGYEELLNLFNIPNLEDRRKYLNLCTMYKIVHDHVYFPYGVFVPRATTLRSASKLVFHQPFARTSSFLHSFVPHTCALWNKLPANITHACTPSAFKFSLTNCLYRNS